MIKNTLYSQMEQFPWLWRSGSLVLLAAGRDALLLFTRGKNKVMLTGLFSQINKI